MKILQKFTTEKFAKPAARIMKYACYFVVIFYVLCTVLAFMGRQAFFLHTKTGSFERAIYASENQDTHSGNMKVYMGDGIHVWTNDNDRIDLSIHVGLSLMYAVHAVPMIVAFWLLSRVFSNIQKGRIFVEQNSSYLLFYGLIQFTEAVFVPFIKLLICRLTNLVSHSRISISTGQSMLNMLFPSIAFMVAAYIIHYGGHLQDEADHTL